MKKKICLIALTLFAMILLLVGCHRTGVPTSYEEATKSYEKVSTATVITKTITETYGDLMIAKFEEKCEKTEGGYLVTTTNFAINGIGEDNTDVTTTKTVDKEAVKTGALLKESDLSNLNIKSQDDKKIITATVNEEALQKLSLELSDVQGAVTVQMTTRENYFDELSLTYTTANGYNIKITFIYLYE